LSDDKPLRWEVRQRLILIEARLIWAGCLTTQDLRGAFGISRSQASKDIALYESLAPDNLQYDLRGRCYRAARSFQPRFLHGTSREFLRALRLFDPESEHPLITLASETAAVELLEMPEREFDVVTLQRVNTAIRERLQLRVDYQSMRVPEPRPLQLSPIALVHTGLRWHLRAFSLSHERFIDVLLSRMRGVPELLDEPGMSADEDWEWKSIVPVRIGAHPGLSAHQRAVIETDYNMQAGVLERRLRIALVPYYLRLMNVGKDDRKRPPEQQQIILLNPEELSELDRLA
jgi:predicted DNA-binding transcriptional regulator YafY